MIDLERNTEVLEVVHQACGGPGLIRHYPNLLTKCGGIYLEFFPESKQFRLGCYEEPSTLTLNVIRTLVQIADILEECHGWEELP